MSLQRMVRGALFLGLSGVAMTAIGCGDDEEQAGPAFTYPDKNSFCVAVAQQQCSQAVVESCFGSDSASLAGDTQTCVSKRAAICNQGPGNYNAAAADACVAAQQAVYADGRFEKAERKTIDDACLLAQNNGGTTVCKEDVDCNVSAGLKCIIKGADDSGRCAVPVEVTGGNDCEDVESQCIDGFYCDKDANACLAIDEDCKADVPCDADSTCEILTGDTEGLCVAKKSNTSDCLVDEECLGSFCIFAKDPEPGEQGSCAAVIQFESTSATCEDFR